MTGILASTAEGLLLRVRVTPKSQRDEVAGVYRGADGSTALWVRVRAIPEDGKGNKAVIETVAAALGLAKSTIGIRSGETGRNKMLLIAGDAAQLQARIAPWLAALRKGKQ
ncbi:MAG: DUF167 family protein [Aestuariivirgaceae bacterium]